MWADKHEWEGHDMPDGSLVHKGVQYTLEGTTWFVLPNQVIKAGAFVGCSTDIIIGENITLNRWAFHEGEQSSSVTIVTFHQSVKSIPTEMFIACPQLQKVTGKGITHLGDNVFELSGVQSVDIPNLQHMGKSCFALCSQLEKIKFELVVSVEDKTFQGCTSLTSVVLPRVNYIDERAFADCSLLTEVKMERCLTVGPYAFLSCKSLQSISVPNAVAIGQYAFMNSGLKEIKLPKTNLIGDGAFMGCVSLGEVVLPNVLKMGMKVFDGCTYSKSTEP